MDDEAPWEPRFDILDLQVVRPLGRGGFGEVFLTKAHPLGADAGSNDEHLFALKRSSLAQVSEAGLERAQDEARLLQRLGRECDCILQCFDFRLLADERPSLELLLEFAPLGDLGSHIRSCRDSKPQGSSSGLPELELVSLACDMMSGLAHLHNATPKILHRDIKPANVVLFPVQDAPGAEQQAKRAKLADFGIAKVLESDMSVAGAATVIGTPHYFSPEMCRGECYDERTDSWSLGCVLYEMVCLQRPFHRAEGNIAALALKVMAANYDKELLAHHAGSYNGSLILTLIGLLSLDPNARLRTSDALARFQKVRQELLGAPARSAVAWWHMHASGTDAAHANNCQAPEDVDMSEDSWAEATQPADSECTINPLQEALGTLRAVQQASPTAPLTGLAATAALERHTRQAEAAAASVQQGSLEYSLTAATMSTVGIGGTLRGPMGLSRPPLREGADGMRAPPRPPVEFMIEGLEPDVTCAEQGDQPRMAWIGGGGDPAMGLLVSEPPARLAEEQQLEASDVRGASSTDPSGSFSGVVSPAGLQHLRAPALADDGFSHVSNEVGAPLWAAPRIFCHPLQRQRQQAAPPPVPSRAAGTRVDTPVIFYFAPPQAPFVSPAAAASVCSGGSAWPAPNGWFEIELSVVTP